VTFDDGYADNLERAKPLLGECGVAATFFIASAYLGGEREFWWDDLERLLLTEGELPRVLRLRLGTETRQWDLGNAAVYEPAQRRRHAGWNVERRDDPTPRHRAYRDLCALLRTCPLPDREAVLHDLAGQARGVVSPRPTHCTLTAKGLSRLADNGALEVGAHSASHPALSSLALEAQEHEIVSSKSAIERATGRSARAFAYPFGTAADYTPATIDLVRRAGFSCACMATPGRVGAGTDPMRLPRMIVRDWDGGSFRDRLNAWFRR
jgi:peptidoglycan/xylan/chitin deacetylase (PgdA/CDA1 family)